MVFGYFIGKTHRSPIFILTHWMFLPRSGGGKPDIALALAEEGIVQGAAKMRNYSSHLTTNPQTQPVHGRMDMVKNNAGGYIFEITPQERLERFILIGSEGGTYYVDEQKLTVENAVAIIKLIKENGTQVVSTVVDFATNNRAPKADPGLFVLALTMTYGNEATKKAAYDSVTKVCRTSTQLFTLVANLKNMRGWSRGLRNAIGKFYTSKTEQQLAYQIVKYRNRAGYTHRDILRLAHPTTTNPGINNILKFAVDKVSASESGNPLIRAFGEAQASSSDDELVSLIREHKLTWEMVPTESLNIPKVLDALLESMPLHALLRNLNRFSSAGMTKGNSDTVRKIVAKLSDKEYVSRSGVHPITVVNATLTYSSGRGFRGGKTWDANQNIVDALNGTFYTALESLASTGKDVLIGVDISDSMGHAVNNSALNASQLANVLALTMLKSEPNSELVWFDTKIRTPEFGRRSSLDEVLSRAPYGGGTDCAQPIIYALENARKYDAIIILTDNETWAGEKHASKALEQYRKSVNSDVKVIEVALVSNPYSNHPSEDKNLLRIVGFDSSVTDVINSYLTK
jgi:60 kDa SS-A/Ro ribonucleoprotein